MNNSPEFNIVDCFLALLQELGIEAASGKETFDLYIERFLERIL